MSMQDTGQEQVQEQAATTAIKLDDFKKEYFSPERQDAAIAKFTEIQASKQAYGFKVQMNFKPEEGIPAGFGLYVVPVASRKKGVNGAPDGNERTHMLIAAVPDKTTLEQHEKGQAYIAAIIANAFEKRVSSAARTGSEMPLSLESFLESKRGRESFKAFTETAKAYTKALKKKGLNYMTDSILKSCLQFRSFSEEKFPTIDQKIWVGIIQRMVAKATELGHDPSIIAGWLETRDQAEQTEIEEFTLEDLDDGFNSDDGDDDNDADETEHEMA